MVRGGCLCGFIRYACGDTISHETICHCTICRRASGAPCVAWFTVKKTDFQITSGQPTSFRSSHHGQRAFCSRCGTALTFESTQVPNLIDVTTSSLDDPDAVPPLDHTHIATRLQWMVLADGLVTHLGARP